MTKENKLKIAEEATKILFGYPSLDYREAIEIAIRVCEGVKIGR